MAGILPIIPSARPPASLGIIGVAAKISAVVRTSVLASKMTRLDHLLSLLASKYTCGRDSSGGPQCTPPCQSGYVKCSGDTFCCRRFTHSRKSDSPQPASFPSSAQIHMFTRLLGQSPMHGPLPVRICPMYWRGFLLPYVHPLHWR